MHIWAPRRTLPKLLAHVQTPQALLVHSCWPPACPGWAAQAMRPWCPCLALCPLGGAAHDALLHRHRAVGSPAHPSCAGAALLSPPRAQPQLQLTPPGTIRAMCLQSAEPGGYQKICFYPISAGEVLQITSKQTWGPGVLPVKTSCPFAASCSRPISFSLSCPALPAQPCGWPREGESCPLG